MEKSSLPILTSFTSDFGFAPERDVCVVGFGAPRYHELSPDPPSLYLGAYASELSAVERVFSALAFMAIS
jgi:hypothetical protein